jgi:biotin carboxylase
MNNLKGKTLLVMDRTALAACAVRRAKELGLKTVVANWYPTKDSPSKQIADIAIDADISDIDGMLKIIKEHKVDGIFVGWTDSHLPFYAEICERAGLPCCGTKEQFDILSNDKRRFKDACLEYGVPVPREYHLTMDFKPEDLAAISYPVLVKPADESGSRGIRKCSNEQELIENYTWLYNRSASKKIFVEQYIESDKEIFLHYTVQDGNFSLSSGFMKHRAISEGSVAASAILHVFAPSYIDLYREKAEPACINMLKKLGLKNGVVMFQGFIDGEDFYFYESGLRMGGEQFYVFAGPLNGISSLDLMIEFAVTGQMKSKNALELDNPKYSKSCVNYYVTLKPGTIASIQGIEEVEAMPQVLQNATFKEIGDTIESSNNLDRVIYR